MNFNDIKNKMDAENMDNVQIPTSIQNFQKSKMPIEKIRKSMKGEIITQLAAIVVFFAVPSFLEMYQLPRSIYYILMFVTSLMTLGYLAKMTWFLNKSSNLSQNSREAVVTFILDLKLTLEVYKTAIIAGSLLLPLSLLALILGTVYTDESLFTNLIMLNIPAGLLVLYSLIYIILAILIYFGTVFWADKLYGEPLKELEKTLKEFDI